MKQPPSSGTAERLAALGALGTVASGGNALLQGSLAGAAPGLGFVPAALAANRFAVNPLLRSQWLANALINRRCQALQEQRRHLGSPRRPWEPQRAATRF